ncbi:MAG: ABC transporter ATP-binding protein [Verrucomicrobiales bacterium]|nr:ABC transporter ATP-binding protein [Verrucomicrobiales bacterium]
MAALKAMGNLRPQFQLYLTFRKVWALFEVPEKRSFLLAFAMMVIGMGFELLGIGIILPVLAVLAGESDGFSFPGIDWIRNALPEGKFSVAIGGVLIGLFLMKNLFLGFQAWVQQRFIFRVQERLSFRLLQKYLSLPYPFHLKRNSAQLIRNATSEMSQLVFNVVSPSMVLLTEIIVVAGIVGFLLIVYPAGTCTAAVILVLACCIYYAMVHRRLNRIGKQRLVHEGLRIQHIQQSLGGVKEVKLLGCEKTFLADYQTHNQLVARASRLLAVSIQLPRLYLEVVGVVAFSAILGMTVYEGQSFAVVMPALGAMAVAAMRLIPSANRIVTSITLLRFGSHGIDTISSEMLSDADSDAIRDTGDGEVAGMTFADRLVVDRVSFTYENVSEPALSDVSFEIVKNTSTGIVGPSGSGKSTLVDLLLGLLKPQSGEILVDQKNIHNNIRFWQDRIGYVPQQIFLYDDSLRRNVAFGIPAESIDDERVSKVLGMADLGDFLAELPDALDTSLGERGVRLSGGQRQRIGIARALYRDPQILVFDEATSALDYESEERVMETIRGIQGHRTVIIVAHRLSTVAQCEQLLRIEAGRLVSEPNNP